MPLQIIRDPSAVRRRTPLEEVDFGPGKTETEAPESTRNSLSESMSYRNRREKLHISGSGSGSGSGSASKKPAGLKGSSTCRTASFLIWNRVSDNAELCYHVSYDTNKVPEKQENGVMEQELENVSMQERAWSWWLQH